MPTTDAGTSLRRTLNVWEAVGVSVALMAPSMAININPQGTAAVVGRAVPLAFLLATVGVLLIAYTFVRLSQRFSHAGSVYGFVGATRGPRAGSVAGWLNAGTYLFYGVVTSTAAGIFINDLIRKLGAWQDSPDWFGFIVAWAVLAVVWFLASREVKGGTRLLLATEGLTIALILIVAAITAVKLLVGDTPNGGRFDMSVFTVAPGTGLSTVFLGVVFGFLSFAGFEAAATLGEETREPRRNIPHAILGTAIFGGVFFVVVTAIEMMGFGADDRGVEAFTKSEALMGDLSRQYVASWLGDVISVGAAISAAACCLACVVSGSRLIFALSRDGMGPRVLATLHRRRNVPHLAAAACVGAVALIQLVGGVSGGAVRCVPDCGNRGHADSPGGLRSGHPGRAAAGVLLGADTGTELGGDPADSGACPAGIHLVPQRHSVAHRKRIVGPGSGDRGRRHRGHRRACPPRRSAAGRLETDTSRRVECSLAFLVGAFGSSPVGRRRLPAELSEGPSEGAEALEADSCRGLPH
jgi:amino acid transporter